MLKRLKHAWKGDRTLVFGIALLLMALAFWAVPLLVVRVPESRYSTDYELVIQEFWQALPVSTSLAGTNNTLEITFWWFSSRRIPAMALLISFAVAVFIIRWIGSPHLALESIKRAWENDRLGVLGIVSAFTAFTLWALPVGYAGCNHFSPNNCVRGGLLYIRDEQDGGQAFFTPERIESVGAFLVLSVILLLLRRR